MPERCASAHPFSTPDLGVVVPCRNEQEVLPSFTERLKSELQQLGWSYEVIMVDDGSTDESSSFLRREAARWKQLSVVRLTRHFGKEAAVQAGLSQSTAEAVVVMDADLQHPPSAIREMCEVWRESDVWVVAAVKKHRVGSRRASRWGGEVFYRVMERLTGLSLRNRSDFQLLDRRAVDLLLSIPERVTIFRGIVAWLGLPTRQITFEVQQREAGESKWSLKQLRRLSIDMITGFTNSPLRAMTYASLLFVAFAGLLALQTLYVYLTGQAVEGFTTVILVVLITGGVLSIGLGIMGEYLARIYEEVKRRPRFVVEETIRPAEDACEHEAESALREDGVQ